MMTNELNCCICLEELNLEKYTNISTTSCNHSYHTSCLLQYKNEKCPICRIPMFQIKHNVEMNVIDTNIIDTNIIEHNIIETNIIETNIRITLVDEYFHEVNIIKDIAIKYLKKILYISFQIIVVLLLIFELNITTSMILMLIHKLFNFLSGGH